MTKLGRPSVWDQHGEEMQRRYEAEQSRGEIARHFGTSVQSVTRVLVRRGVVFEDRQRDPNAGRTPERQAEINAKVSAAKLGVPLGPRKPVEHRICESCNQPYEYHKGRTGERFCSRQCRTDFLAAEGKAGAEAEYDLEPRRCVCGTAIPYEYRHTRQFCGPEHRKQYGAKKKADPANTIEGTCQNPACARPGGKFTYPKAQGHRRYCSDRCSQEHTRPNEKLNDLEGAFYYLTKILGLGVRRPEGSEQILYGTRGSYAPDFIVEWGGEQLAVETKGEYWLKEETKAKHAAWRAQGLRLAVVYVSDLLRLRLAADAQACWNALLHLSVNS